MVEIPKTPFLVKLTTLPPAHILPLWFFDLWTGILLLIFLFKPTESIDPIHRQAKPLYNPAEADEIVKHPTADPFGPEYILLFGKTVGGTRHNDTTVCNRLMVVCEIPEYDWLRAKRILRY